ncbi:hypothetical protein OROGR_017115 [Orobanche gracilis]
MSKKSKGVGLGSTSRYGVYEDAKSRLKHQTLMQDYEELRRETDAMRSKLEAAQHRKSILAAEVRFLRKRYNNLAEANNNMILPQHQNYCEQASNSLKQTKTPEEQILALVPERKKKMKRQHVVEQVGPSLITDQTNKKTPCGRKHDAKSSSTVVLNLNHKGKKRVRKEEIMAPNMTTMLEKKGKERMIYANDAALRSSTAGFDLNQDCGLSAKETSLRSRAPTFDLNEILTEDEDFQMNVETVMLEEAKRSFTRGIIVNEEQQTQNDLKLAICRNSGEGSSRVGKRKISWQDPVALRV